MLDIQEVTVAHAQCIPSIPQGMSKVLEPIFFLTLEPSFSVTYSIVIMLKICTLYSLGILVFFLSSFGIRVMLCSRMCLDKFFLFIVKIVWEEIISFLCLLIFKYLVLVFKLKWNVFAVNSVLLICFWAIQILNLFSIFVLERAYARDFVHFLQFIQVIDYSCSW